MDDAVVSGIRDRLATLEGRIEALEALECQRAVDKRERAPYEEARARKLKIDIDYHDGLMTKADYKSAMANIDATLNELKARAARSPCECGTRDSSPEAAPVSPV